ncbi:MAG: hypothetical protein ACERKZ_14885 [Lachnotalea sp.]
MMKIQKLFALVVLVFMVFLFQMEVSAETGSIEVNITDECKNCLFKVQWENEDKEAIVEIISPDGQKFSDSATPERITKGQGKIYINVGDIAAGKWSVNVSGEGLGKVTADAGELPSNVNIDNFTISPSNDGIVANWQISNWSDNLHIQIFADDNKEGYDGIKVVDTGALNNDGITFQPNGLTNGYYFYYICVSDSIGAFLYEYSEAAIKYENVNSAVELTNIKVSMLNNDIYVSWSGDVENYKTIVYDPGTMELLDEAVTQDQSYVFPMPEGYSNVKVGVATYINEQLGKYELYEVSNESLPDATVTYPDGEYTNLNTIIVNVSFDGNYTVSATLNDELKIDNSASAGDYRISLADGDNSIAFIVRAENGNMRTYIKKIYVDTTPPQLALNNDLNNIRTTNKYVYLQGYSESGVSLTCNEKKIEMLNNYFSYKYPLHVGKNEIVLSSKDLTGNETRYTAIVTRSLIGSKEFVYIIIGFIGLLLLAFYSIIFVKGVKRRGKGEKS